MSKELFKSFVKAIDADQGLQQKVKNASTPDQYAELATTAGVPMTEELIHVAIHELNEDDLEELAGGWFGDHWWHDIKHDSGHFVHLLKSNSPWNPFQKPTV